MDRSLVSYCKQKHIIGDFWNFNFFFTPQINALLKNIIVTPPPPPPPSPPLPLLPPPPPPHPPFPLSFFWGGRGGGGGDGGGTIAPPPRRGGDEVPPPFSLRILQKLFYAGPAHLEHFPFFSQSLFFKICVIYPRGRSSVHCSKLQKKTYGVLSTKKQNSLWHTSMKFKKTPPKKNIIKISLNKNFFSLCNTPPLENNIL